VSSATNYSPGLLGLGAAALDTTRAEIESGLAVNLFGVFFTAQGYAREMVKRRSGSIVAIGPISGVHVKMASAVAIEIRK